METLVDLWHHFRAFPDFEKRTIIFVFVGLYMLDMLGLIYAQIKQITHDRYYQYHLQKGLLKINLIKASAVIVFCFSYERSDGYTGAFLIAYTYLVLSFWVRLIKVRKRDGCSRSVIR